MTLKPDTHPIRTNSMYNKTKELLFKIDKDQLHKTDKEMQELFDMYKPSKGEEIGDALHGIDQALITIDDKQRFNFESFMDDLHYYSDRWTLWRVARMKILWTCLLTFRSKG